RKWRQARSIPARHWPALLAATGLALGDLPGAETTAPQNEKAPDMLDPNTPPTGATAVLALADGSLFWGRGFGAHAAATEAAEICFNTGLTGYQETLTDPSY